VIVIDFVFLQIERANQKLKTHHFKLKTECQALQTQQLLRRNHASPVQQAVDPALPEAEKRWCCRPKEDYTHCRHGTF